MMLKTLLIGTIAISLNIVTSKMAKAITFVTTPSGFEEVEGISGSPSIFNAFFERRTQVYYDKSYFPSVITINQIRFRLDESVSSLSPRTIPDIQIGLSTLVQNEFSDVLDENLGDDFIVVRERGPLTISSTGNSSNGITKDFDIVIDLDNPFKYDPTIGNLLMEVRTFDISAGGLTINTSIDIEFSQGFGGQAICTPSRVLPSIGCAVSATGANGTVNNASVGNIPVTQFVGTTTKVPEPQSLIGFLALIGLGSITLKHKFNS